MNPFQKVIDALNSIQITLPAVGWSLIVVAIITCGIMFVASDRLSEKAKPWLFKIAIGGTLIGGASVIASWLHSGF